MDGENIEFLALPAADRLDRKVDSLLWLNLLSLDAPAVAVLWQLLFARSFQVWISPAITLLLGLVVWLIYISDRLLDTRAAPAQGIEPLRHQFYRRHWHGSLIGAAVVMALSAWMALELLDRRVFFGGLLLAFGVAAYFILIQARNIGKPGLLPKEALVGVLFSAGTCFPIAQLLPSGRLIITPFLLFGTLCWVNCASIEHLEWTRLRASRADRPHQSTVFLGRHLAMAGSVIALIAIAGLILSLDQKLAPLFGAMALSAAVFAALKQWSESLSSDHFRVLMDIALFTPVLFLLL